MQCVSIEDIPDEDGSVYHIGRETYILIDDDLDNEWDSLFDGNVDGNMFDEYLPEPKGLGDGHCQMALLQQDALDMLKDLQVHMHGESCGAAGGYKAPIFDPFVRHRLEGMHMLLNLYTCPDSLTYGKWQHSTKQASVGVGNQSAHCMHVLCHLIHQYLADHTILPINPSGHWKKLMLADEGVLNEVQLYLQALTHITVPKLHELLTSNEFMEQHGINKPITPRTAGCYIEFLDYRFGNAKRSQYSDGHEQEDVVKYWDYEFLPRWAELLGRSF